MRNPESMEIIEIMKSCYYLAKPFLEDELLDKLESILLSESLNK